MRTLSTLSTLTSVLILSATGIASAEESNVLERNRSARLQSDSTGRIAARPATPPSGGQTGGGGYVDQGDRDCPGCEANAAAAASAEAAAESATAEAASSSPADAGASDAGSSDAGSSDSSDSE